MKLISLRGRNIGLLKGDFEFSFDEALTVVTGPIGCGKSTILTMIRASLTNTFPGNASSWASWGIPPQEACYFVATWRIGNKTLHIAKCVAGDKQFATLNIPRLTIESDDGLVEEITSSRDALERTLSLIPVPASIIDGHLIVDQDSITAPVASTPAKFKETIHTLTRTNELEILRAQIKDLLGSVVVPDVQAALEQAQVDVNMDQGELDKQQAEFGLLKSAATDLDIVDVNLRLDTLELVKRNNEQYKRLEAELKVSTASKANFENSKRSHELGLAANSELVDTLAAEAEIARGLLYSIDAILKANSRIAQLNQDQATVNKQLAELAANTIETPANTAPTEAQLDEATGVRDYAKQELAIQSKRLQLALAGNCPECGTATSLCAHDLSAMQQTMESLADMKLQSEQMIVNLKAATKAYAEYEVRAKNWLDSVERLNTKQTTTQSELDSLKDTPVMDVNSKAQLTFKVSKHDEAKQAVTRHENDIASLNWHLQNELNTSTRLTKDMAALPPAIFDPNEHARLSKLVEDHLQLRMRMATITGALETANKALVRSKSRLQVQVTRAAQVKPIEQFRGVLEKAAGVLLKDGLPKLLSLQYMGKLNARLAFYLSTINAEFTAYIDENLEFTARKADGLVHRANRLSGGQKQQASVAYLLAVNDVFASTLGILALDEPSGAMQEGNSQELAEAFSYLAKVGKQTGRQFIVITHSTALAAHGCTNIALQGA